MNCHRTLAGYFEAKYSKNKSCLDSRNPRA